MTSPGREREIPPPADNPGMRETDDHFANPASAGGHQPTNDLDRGVGDEHVSSPSQGVRPERSPAGTDAFAGGGIASGGSDLHDDEEALGGGPSGDDDAGGGPAFEEPR